MLNVDENVNPYWYLILILTICNEDPGLVILEDVLVDEREKGTDDQPIVVSRLESSVHDFYCFTGSRTQEHAVVG